MHYFWINSWYNYPRPSKVAASNISTIDPHRSLDHNGFWDNCRLWRTSLLQIIAIIIIICWLPACFATKLEVTIVGVSDEIKQTLQNNLTIYNAITEPKLSELRIKNLHDLAEQQLNDILEAIGYYGATINSSLKNSQDNWHANYLINLGPPIIIKTISLKIKNAGATDLTLNKKLTMPKLHQGDILTHANYELTKQNLLMILQEHGYLSAEFSKHDITIDPNLNQANIALEIDTGKQYVLGNVTFVDCKYSQEFLQGFVNFTPGEAYTSKALAKFRKNLTDPAMFQKIKISPKPNLLSKQDNKVPIEVSLKNTPLNHYTGSFGFGTNTGFRGGLGWQHRFLVPAGHQLNTFLAISKIRRQAGINYVIPGKNPGTDRYIIGTNVIKETIRDQTSIQRELSLTKTSKIAKQQRYYSLKYTAEKFRFSPEMAYEKTRFLLPSAKWIWSNPNEKDDVITFGEGTRLELGLQGGVGCLFSSTNFVQTEVLGKWIKLLRENTRIILIGNLGTTALTDFNKLPLSLRYFAGGDKSIRGFGYRTLGPTAYDSSNTLVTIGGKNLIVTTLELEQKIRGNISVAIFADAGNAMNSWHTKFAAGAGVGLRWATPIGAFKLDLARQIAQIQQRKFRVHLTFGTDL